MFAGGPLRLRAVLPQEAPEANAPRRERLHPVRFRPWSQSVQAKEKKNIGGDTLVAQPQFSHRLIIDRALFKVAAMQTQELHLAQCKS
jgi:hypothetical protein